MNFWINNRDTIFTLVFGSFGLSFLIFSIILFNTKRQIFNAFRLYQQDKRITKKDITDVSMSILDFFYAIVPIPFHKSDAKFYEIELVKIKKRQYRKYTRWYLIYLFIYSILIVVLILFDIKISD